MEAGLGPAYFHNHQQEFNTRFMDNGALIRRLGIHHGPHRSALGLRADRHRLGGLRPRLHHARRRGRRDEAQAEVTRLINKFQNRIVSYHVKDMVAGEHRADLRQQRSA